MSIETICKECKGDGFTYPLVCIECTHCENGRKTASCKECGGEGREYRMIPYQCDTCKGTGFTPPKFIKGG